MPQKSRTAMSSATMREVRSRCVRSGSADSCSRSLSYVAMSGGMEACVGAHHFSRQLLL